MRHRLFWLYVGYRLAGLVRRARLAVMDEDRFDAGVAEARRVREAWKDSDARKAAREAFHSAGERR